MIESPARRKQRKTTRQQIHSHLKKVHVSRFPVVSNEAIQDLNSFVVNKHTQCSDSLHKTVNGRWCQSRHLEINNILKQTAPQELHKVLSIKFYAEFTKRNGVTNELESLKIIQSATERYLKEKTIHGWASRSRESFTTQKKSIAELHRLHHQIPSPKTTRSLSLNHRRKESLQSLIQATRIKL